MRMQRAMTNYTAKVEVSFCFPCQMVRGLASASRHVASDIDLLYLSLSRRSNDSKQVGTDNQRTLLEPNVCW